MSIMFEPVNIGPMEVKNRFVHSATHESMAARTGSITEDILKRYQRLARGQIGLIIPGHLYVDTLGKAHFGQSGIHTDAMIPGLKNLVDAVHEEGGKIAFQLAHGGRQSPRTVIGRPPFAPSASGRDPVTLDKPRQMDQADIHDTVRAFGAAAQRAAAAGADAVQIHAAHGFLINEFLSPFFNRRKDEWGGTDSGRFRFLKAIISKVREVLPDTMPVMVKLNTNDYTPGPGITPNLAATYAKWMVALGVAAVEVSCGTYYGFQTIRGEIPGAELVRALPMWMRPVARVKMKLQASANRFQEAYNLEAAQTVKPVLGKARLILVGGVRRLSQMEEIIENGHAHMIAMSRPFIREPFLVSRFYEKKATEAACISCNKCFAAMFNSMPIRCYYKGLPRS